MKRMHACSGYGFKLILASLVLAVAQSAMARSGGQLVFQFVGRNIVTNVTNPGSDTPAGEAFTVGYYTYIAGIPRLFSGPATMSTANAYAATAYFTFRSESYGFSTLENENTYVRPVTPGFLIKIYYNQTPDQSFDDPDTFSDGQLIATFKVLTSQAIRVEDGKAASQQGSLELVSSRPFRFRGKTYMIRSIVHKGVSQVSSGAAVPLDPTHPVFAFSGSAFAY